MEQENDEAIPGPSNEMTPTKRQANLVIHSEEMSMMMRMIECCETEKKEKTLSLTLNQALKRVSEYSGKSLSSVKRMNKYRKEHPEGKPTTPGKKRPRASPKSSVDDFDARVIRDIIADFYIQKKQVPTLHTLQQVMHEKIKWEGSKTSLSRLLKRLGFVWKRTQDKRKVLLQRQDIVNWRSQYLIKLKHFRANNRKIYYIDETWIDSNMTIGKCWQRPGDVEGVLSWNNASKRLIVVHVGSSTGFVEGAQLIFQAGLATGDYHGQMNSINFEKWIREKVMNNLDPGSVVVMDNAPYHNKQQDKPPSPYENKTLMVEWLNRNGVAADMSMRKITLNELISKHKPKEKVYRVDKELEGKGHTVVRLPPYNCDLSPIELAWAKVKLEVRKNNVTADLSMTTLRRLTTQAIAAVLPQDWESYTRHIINLEEDYWHKDGLLENAVDEFVIRMDSDEDDSEGDY